MWEFVSMLFTETARYIGYIVTAALLLLVLRIVWTYVSISCVLYYTYCRYVISDPDYIKRNGRVYWLTFRKCFSLPYVFDVAGTTLRQEFLAPVPVFSINYDFKEFVPRFTLTYRNTLPLIKKIVE